MATTPTLRFSDATVDSAGVKRLLQHPSLLSLNIQEVIRYFPGPSRELVLSCWDGSPMVRRWVPLSEWTGRPERLGDVGHHLRHTKSRGWLVVWASWLNQPPQRAVTAMENSMALFPLGSLHSHPVPGSSSRVHVAQPPCSAPPKWGVPTKA